MSNLLQNDEQFLADCRCEVSRGSGPGGQKRNKTSNAVRLTHLPTGVSVRATEARSLAENQLNALRRLRLRIACDLRHPIDLPTFTPPDYFLQVRREQRIEMSRRHPSHARVAALVLDLLAATHGRLAMAAAKLGVSTSSVTKLLEAEPQLWTAANAIRAGLGMPALLHRK